MNQQVLDYLKYGIFNNTLCFPYNKNSIRKYIRELEPLGELMKKESPRNIIKALKKENSNIFIASYVATILDIDEHLYQILLNKVENRYDMYVLVNSLCSRKKIDRKLINRLYQDKIGIMGDYKGLLFDICKPRTDTQLLLRKRNKALFEIKQKMDTGEVEMDVLEKIKEHQIHPSEIGYYMSYYFDIRAKEVIALHFLKTYGVLEVLPHIDTWFIDFIPVNVVKAIEDNIYDLNKIEDIVGLLILYKKISNGRIKNIIYNVFNNYSPSKSDTRVSIHIAPTQKSGYRIDKSEKYDFLYLIGVNSILLDAEFDSNIYINKIPIEGTLMEKLHRFDEHQITLKPSVQTEEDDVINILFSNIVEPGFDIAWDITAEKNVAFKNIGLLHVKGRSYDLIACLFKYLKDH